MIFGSILSFHLIHYQWWYTFFAVTYYAMYTPYDFKAHVCFLNQCMRDEAIELIDLMGWVNGSNKNNEASRVLVNYL